MALFAALLPAPVIVRDDGGSNHSLRIGDVPESSTGELIARTPETGWERQRFVSRRSVHLQRGLAHLSRFVYELLKFFFFSSIAYAWTLALVNDFGLRNASPWWRALIIVAGIGVVHEGGRFLFGVRSHEARKAASELKVRRLRAGRCGVCGYLIHSVPVAEDGLATCPECSARWKTPAWINDVIRQPRAPAVAAGRSPWRMRITDARGEVLIFACSRSLAESRRLSISLGSPRFWSVGHWELGAVAVVLVGVTAFAVSTWLAAGEKAARAAAVFTLAVLVPVVTLMRIQRWAAQNPSAAATTLVLRGTCPHCEGPLRADPAPSDGARLCEECGAAWLCGKS